MNERFDELWPQGPRFLQAEGVFSLGTDSVLLAHFTDPAHCRHILDLGCGGGVLSVLLGLREPKARLDCVDILPQAAQACRRNLEANGLADRARVLEGDLRLHKEFLTAGAYDLVVSNPPYFPTASGKTAPDPLRAAARDERSCSLEELCRAAAWLCRWGGRFCLVHRPERLSEVFCALTAAGLEPKRLQAVAYKADSAPTLVLIEARRGGKPGLSFLPPLILAKADGSESEIVQEIYHRRNTP